MGCAWGLHEWRMHACSVPESMHSIQTPGKRLVVAQCRAPARSDGVLLLQAVTHQQDFTHTRTPHNTHRIEINGLVERPCSLSMDELLQLPSVTLPVTLVCAGNRRKEENMIKKSIGFNWGPCAVSTSYWTGARAACRRLLAWGAFMGRMHGAACMRMHAWGCMHGAACVGCLPECIGVPMLAHAAASFK